MERCERCHDNDDPDIIEGMCFRHWVVSELLSISDQLAIIGNEEEDDMSTEQETLDQIAALSTAVDNQTKTVGAIATETAAIRAAQIASAGGPAAIPQSITDALAALGAKDATIQAALDAEVTADAPPAPPATPAAL